MAVEAAESQGVTKHQALPPMLVDIQGLSALLQRSVASLRRDEAHGRLPAGIKIGRSKRWCVAEIQAWVTAGAPSQVQNGVATSLIANAGVEPGGNGEATGGTVEVVESQEVDSPAVLGAQEVDSEVELTASVDAVIEEAVEPAPIIPAPVAGCRLQSFGGCRALGKALCLVCIEREMNEAVCQSDQ